MRLGLMTIVVVVRGREIYSLSKETESDYLNKLPALHTYRICNCVLLKP